MSTIGKISIAQLSQLFQTAFGGFETETAGWDHGKFIGSLEVDQDFVGNELKLAQLIDYGGGQSSGSLPDSSVSTIYNPVLNAKRVYSTSTIDNEAIAAAQAAGMNKGAFMKAVELSMLTLKGSFMDQVSRQFFGDGTGTLGVVSTVTVNAVGDYTIVITAGSWIEANWMLKDLVNFAMGTSQFLITEITLSTRTIRVVRQTGADVPGIGNNVYKQKSRDNEMTGLKAVVDTAAGDPLYGVNVGYRWQASTFDAGGQAISVKLLRELDRQIRYQARVMDGVASTDYIMSAKQYNIFEDSEEGKSIIYVEPTVAPERMAGGEVAHAKVNGHLIRVSWSPWCPDDRIYAVNRNKIAMKLRPNQASGAKDPGGFIMNGDSVFFPLQVSGTPQDAFQLFYKTYGELYINPVYTGAITGLATS
jgi:hypothetical protein